MIDDPLDACLRLVSDRHRRLVVQRLRHEVEGETTFDDLVDRLHGAEPVSATDRRTTRDRIAIELAHTHLPKLADYSVVEYDVEAGTVRYRSDEQVEAVLDALPGEVAQASP